MKKKAILALTLAGIVALQMPMVALAEDRTTEVTGDATVNGNLTVPGRAIIIGEGNTVTVTGDVSSTFPSPSSEDTMNAIYLYDSNDNNVTINKNAVSNAANKSVIANDGGTVHVKGDVTGASSQAAVMGNGEHYKSETTVDGVVANSGSGLAISAEMGAKVEAGNVSTAHGGITVNGATVTAGNVTVKPLSAETETDSMSGVLVKGADSKVSVGNIQVLSSKDLAFGLSVELSSAGNNAEVMTKDVIVTGDDGTGGVEISTEAANTKATVLVDGNISCTKDGAVIEAKEGTVQFVTTGTISGDDFALVIQQDSKTEKIEIVAYGLETSASGHLIGKQTNETFDGEIYVTEATTEYDSLVNYIIRKKEGSESSLTTFETTEKTITTDGVERKFDTAKAGTKIIIKAASGYEVKAEGLIVTKESDGSYSVIVPAGGGVTLEAVVAAVQQAAAEEEKKATLTGSEGNAVKGQWNAGPGGCWTFRTDGILKNTWGYIQLEDGRTGWFWFDKNGVMATGWQEINGKWYYFNEVHDGTYGMMLSNTTTPDGRKVGADGARID